MTIHIAWSTIGYVAGGHGLMVIGGAIALGVFLRGFDPFGRL